MGNRRRSRELALQALYYMDIRHSVSEDTLALFRVHFPPSVEIEPFFTKLATGVMEETRDIDKIIERCSSNWRVRRMTCVDRNIMRIAVYELLRCRDIPPKVSINEAVDMGKRFGSDDSGAFINGILDSVRMEAEQEKDKKAPP